MNSSRWAVPLACFCIFAVQVALLSGAAPVRAVDEPWTASAFSVDAPTLFQSATAGPDPGELGVVVYLEDTSYTFETDGRSTYRHHLIYKITNQKGVDEISAVSAEWEPWHESQPTVRARVIDPDLSVHELDPKTMAESGSKSSDDDVYTDSKTIQGPLPALVPGAVVEELFEIAETQPLFAEGYASRISLSWDVPVMHSRVTLSAPGSLPLHASARGSLQIQQRKEENGGNSEWLFSMENIAASKDTPVLLPSEVARGPEVSFSTANSWRDVVAGYTRILDQQIKPDEAKGFAAPAITGKKDRDAIISALVSRLDKEIRYTGVEFGQSSLVPETASVVLHRKYGDCKDKASLLVAMLRTAGIPAYVALLSAGPGEDVDPASPGMGMFDHAIVYVPGTPDLWIDATDDYARVGHIPGDDQGRMALIVEPGQSTLTRTPESTSADNRSIETREFVLAETGPAQVVETSDSWGSIDAGYRSLFDDDSKKVHDQLEKYMKQVYLADKLTKLDSTDFHDLSVPFRIRLQADSAKRGNSDDSEAVVVIYPNGLTNRLPDYFTREEDKEAKKPTEPRTEDFVLGEPYTLEWHYHIVPPPGFQANPLPPARDQQIGPAHLTAQFAKSTDGSVNATLRFDTGKRRMTAQDADALRTGVLALEKENATMISFNEVGEADLVAGKVKEALVEFHSLAAMHPKEALHRDQIARALLAGGMGELARKEVQHATELDPTSARAYANLAFVLEHDLIGRQFHEGFDLDGALAAFQRALDLDPKNSTIRGDYAILLEYNKGAVRHGPGARTNDAVDQYRAVGDDLEEISLSENLPFALMWAHRFSELKEEAEKLAPSSNRQQFLLVARAAIDGSAAAIQEATQDDADAAARRSALLGAGQHLLDLRLYPQAADLISAGAQGNSDAASLLAQASVIRQLKRHEDLALPDSDPRSLMIKMLIAMRGEARSIQDLSSLFTEESASYFADPEISKSWMNWAYIYRMADENRNIPLDVGLDMDIAALQIAADGSDSLGYRIHAGGPTVIKGKIDSTIFVVKEDGKYRIAATMPEPDLVGSEVLHLVDTGNLTAAAQWLDWLHSDTSLSTTSDDPLNLPIALLFWKKGEGQNLDAIRYAAAALMGQMKPFASIAAPILIEGSAKASTDAERQKFDYALTYDYFVAADYANMLPIAQKLYDELPDSPTAFHLLNDALIFSKKFDESVRLEQDNLSKALDDPKAIRDYAFSLWQAGRREQALDAMRQLTASGKATADDFNNFAWAFLMEDEVTPEAVRAAERATLLSQGNQGSIVDTQAAIYAEIGKPADAYTMELRAVDLEGAQEPNAGNWYVLGRIAEQDGEPEAAVEDYKRCEPPTNAMEMAVSPYLLAQTRLKALARPAQN